MCGLVAGSEGSLGFPKDRPRPFYVISMKERDSERQNCKERDKQTDTDREIWDKDFHIYFLIVEMVIMGKSEFIGLLKNIFYGSV